MYKLCKTEQSAARQRQLEIGLLEAMSSHHYEEISVSDLCDQMQVPRKSFYRYFSGKDGALHALIDHTLLEYEGEPFHSSNRDGRTRLQLESFFLFWQQHKALLDALQRSGLSGVLIERAITHSVNDASICSNFSSRQEKIEMEHATMFAVCGLMSMMLQWHHDNYPMTTREMAAIAVRILTQHCIRKCDNRELRFAREKSVYKKRRF